MIQYMDFLRPNNSYNASLTADYTAGDATLSVSTVPINFPTLITVARGTSKETRFTVTGGGSGLLTGVTRLDGANENISAGVSVECMNDAEYITQLEAAVFTQIGLKSLVYAADGGSTDTYAITLSVAPTAYTDILGLPIAFKANTVNTGAATLNVNSLGAKTIKKNYNEDLADGDIKANQIVIVVYDGTNFQLLSPSPNLIVTPSSPSQGDVLYYNGTNWTSLPAGTSGQFLKTQGTGANPVWATVASKVVQIVTATTTSETNESSGSYADTTLTATITPTSTSNKVLVVVMHGDIAVQAASTGIDMQLLRDASVISSLGKLLGYNTNASNPLIISGPSAILLDSPATVSATTYKTQFKRSGGSGTVQVQKNNASSFIALFEVTP